MKCGNARRFALQPFHVSFLVFSKVLALPFVGEWIGVAQIVLRAAMPHIALRFLWKTNLCTLWWGGFMGKAKPSFV